MTNVHRDQRFAVGGAPIGRLPVWSINTWIIAINIAVFAMANVFVLFPNTRVPLGVTYADGVTQEQILRQVRIGEPHPAPGAPGVFETYICDPKQVRVDQFGRIEVDSRTGVPLPRVIGAEYFQIMPLLHAWGHFSTLKAFFGVEVWRFVTFQFLHQDATHLVFNMLGLWFVGHIVEAYLGRKGYLAFYLVSGIFGAVLYLLLNFSGYLIQDVFQWKSARVPGVLFNEVYTTLIGASAGVFGVLMGAAFISPRAEITVAYVIPMRMKTGVYLFFVLALGNLILGGRNAGGDAAHIGGALAGYYFIRRPRLLRDFFDFYWLDWIGSGQNRGAGGGRRQVKRERMSDTGNGAAVDQALAHAADGGLQALTIEEREAIRRAATETSGNGHQSDEQPTRSASMKK